MLFCNIFFPDNLSRSTSQPQRGKKKTTIKFNHWEEKRAFRKEHRSRAIAGASGCAFHWATQPSTIAQNLIKAILYTFWKNLFIFTFFRLFVRVAALSCNKLKNWIFVFCKRRTRFHSFLTNGGYEIIEKLEREWIKKKKKGRKKEIMIK